MDTHQNALLKKLTASRLLLLAVVLAASTSPMAGCAGDSSIRSFAQTSNKKVLARPGVFVRHPEVARYVNGTAGEVLAAARQYRSIEQEKDAWIYDKLEVHSRTAMAVKVFETHLRLMHQTTP